MRITLTSNHLQVLSSPGIYLNEAIWGMLESSEWVKVLSAKPVFHLQDPHGEKNGGKKGKRSKVQIPSVICKVQGHAGLQETVSIPNSKGKNNPFRC